MRKFVKIMLLSLAVLVALPQEAEAIDPVTIAILAPIALQLANAARPYLIRAATNTAKGALKVGKDMIELIYLPYGLGKMLFGWPWGGFRSGLVYTIRGGIAPGKMIMHTLLLPVYMVGIEVNM